MTSARASSSTSLPAFSIAPSNEPSLYRAGGLVASCLTSKSCTLAWAGWPSAAVSAGRVVAPSLSRSSSASASWPQTARQPATTSTLPVVRKVCEPTKVVRTVSSNSAIGKKTAMKRRVTKSKIFRSISSKPWGMVPVGTMAKWSLTLALSKTRLPARSTQPWSSASRAKLPALCAPLRASSTVFAVAT